MKRSEMVIQMTEYWFGLLPGELLGAADVDKELFDEVSGRMNSLLNFLESEMKPHCMCMFPNKDCESCGSSFVWENE